MALENREERRLTAEQRDRVLDIAARLQAQHQATTTVEDLTQAANEAGIDSRFVHEAIERLDVKPKPLTTPWFPLGLFVLQATFLLMMWNSRFGSTMYPPSGLQEMIEAIPLHETLVAAVVSVALSFWASQQRPIRWIAPAAVAIIWTVVGIVNTLFLNQAHLYAPWAPTLATALGFVQVLAAVVGAFLAAGWAASVRKASEG